MILSFMSDEAKHNTTVVAVGTSVASWLIDHTSLITALVGVATLVWVMLGAIERLQHVYFNWKYGPIGKGDDE